MKIKIRKMYEFAYIPTYGSAGSACIDLYSIHRATIYSGYTTNIHTGIQLEIPEGYVGLIFARSGLATRNGVAPANKVGVIDSDYRGEIIIPLHNHSSVNSEIKAGDRVAQMLILPYDKIVFEEVEEITETERNQNGFGSTGK